MLYLPRLSSGYPAPNDHTVRLAFGFHRFYQRTGALGARKFDTENIQVGTYNSLRVS